MKHAYMVYFYREERASVDPSLDHLLDVIQIRRAHRMDRAVKAARKRFEKRRGLADWKEMAGRTEVREIITSDWSADQFALR